MLASPANPTGTMLSAAELANLGESPARRSGWFISDEIYHGLTYWPPRVTAPFLLGRGDRYQ